MRPAFALEHLEHLDISGIERIAFDLLKMHGHHPPFARAFDLSLCQLIRRLIHAAKDTKSGG